MKTIISAMILGLLLLISFTACSQTDASTPADNDATVTQQVKISGPVAIESAITETNGGTFGGFISANWGKLVLGLLSFYDLVARLTPTEKDNTIVTFLTKLLNAVIPNNKKGGGKL
jgi:hypothetical protein